MSGSTKTTFHFVCLPGFLSSDAARTAGFIPKVIYVFLAIISTILPAALMVIGFLHVDDCPAQKMIPLSAIAVGGMWLLYILFKFPCEIRRLYSTTEPEKNFCCACIAGIIQFLLLACFIAACYWVYSTLPYIDERDLKSENYCDPLLFRFLFWLLNGILILIVIVIVVVVLIAVIAWCCK
ncbi:transmembrane protein 272-like [Uloborus diversus]|uniref:transmembrane protein 272-like n=1 Tax=Uloborus diversus TaxID=327109 RepID=UPI002409F301|nr:transmembrane protein 272-like [Uloborus diversus]XP_054707817.1 transmembrane protein 272-like [Uloborus diversus]